MGNQKVTPPNHHRLQVKALKLAIEVLKRERRRNFSAGERAYNLGMRKYEINSHGITGMGGAWAEDDHLSYLEYSQAIQELEDLIEIMNDPGAIRE